MAARPHVYRLVAAHLARLAVVAAIAWLIHAEHRRFITGHSAADFGTLPLTTVQHHLPEAAAIGGESAAVAGGRDLLGADGARVGTLLRTSPAGDAAIGFSGPTDLLLVCDADLHVTGVEILSSRDTRDHVHAIERDSRFLNSFNGKSLDDVAELPLGKADAVAGSTLTSLAIAEAIVLRLGGSAGSRFETAPVLADLLKIFPDATAIEPDLGGIGPGYAVDSIGTRLVELGSSDHLVELGGEVRAWGVRGPGLPWRVMVRGTGEGGGGAHPRCLERPFRPWASLSQECLVTRKRRISAARHRTG